MIPNKPDHPFVFGLHFKNAASLLDALVKYFTTTMALHSKTRDIDDEIASVGTANMDHRSFTLNFEVHAFIYDQQIAKRFKTSFSDDDLAVSSELTKHVMLSEVFGLNLKRGISQLLSPIL